MTSSVRVTAHCSNDKQVQVSRYNSDTKEMQNQVLKNLESVELSIYDAWSILTKEIEITKE